MKSLDEAVEKFRLLKEKLRNISEQSSKQTPTFPKSDKQNVKNSQNAPHFPSSLHQLNLHHPTKDSPGLALKSKVVESEKGKVVGKQKQKERTVTNEDDNIDNKTQTQKKINHRKNNSWNFSNKEIIHENRSGFLQDNCKLNSLNSSRLSEAIMKKQLSEKEKTLGEINNLLQKKKQVLEALEKKIGHSFLEESNFENTLAKSKRSIRAPNLFQMQAEGRKRSKSKTLTIRWK